MIMRGETALAEADKLNVGKALVDAPARQLRSPSSSSGLLLLLLLLVLQTQQNIDNLGPHPWRDLADDKGRVIARGVKAELHKKISPTLAERWHFSTKLGIGKYRYQSGNSTWWKAALEDRSIGFW
jgi:hypothetical protein